MSQPERCGMTRAMMWIWHCRWGITWRTMPTWSLTASVQR
ncbi:MAG: DUF2752 domain-containing protein [Candidatus Marinimicrobia bacterium]|nr:DUF2752 domain-containing protein [Candidatus Neomarinimicrobiota bacterium]MCF7903393.1 DUF2752 domain-containing protein [Candidatus Neomarinimicrobiota bacterium]